MAEADIKWFTNAKVNIVKTVSTAKKGDKTAIILNQMIQMKNLHISIMNCTNVFANGKCLKNKAYKRDRVCIYLP
jgi:acetyl-CoA synthetase